MQHGSVSTNLPTIPLLTPFLNREGRRGAGGPGRVSRLSFPLSVLVGVLFLLSFSSCHHYRYSERRAQLDSLQRANQADAVFRSDSLQRILADYFDRHGTPDDRMLAHYILGRAYSDLGEAPKALEEYYSATEIGKEKKVPNYDLLMRIHSQMAALFYSQYLPEMCLQELDKACDNALSNRDTLSYALCMEQKVRAYYQLGMSDSVLYVSDFVKSIYNKLGREDMAARCMSTAIAIQIKEKQYDVANENINNLEAYIRNHDVKNPLIVGSYYSYKGAISQSFGSFDSAVYYYRKQLELGNNLKNIVTASQGLFNAYKSKRVPDSISKYASVYCAANDSSNVFNSADRLQNMHSMYNYERLVRIAEKQTLEIKNKNLVLICTFLIVVLVFSITFYYISVYKTNQKKRLKEVNQKYTSVLSSYLKEQQELALLKNTIIANAELIDKKEAEIGLLKEEIALFQSDKATPDQWDVETSVFYSDFVLSLHKHAGKGLQITESQFATLQKTMETLHPGFEKAIEDKHHSMKYKHRLICILTKLRFVPSEIASLSGMSLPSLGNMRKRLLKEMFGKDGSASAFDEEIWNYRCS